MRRLYLLRILMAAPNVLILDEPTNDLDIETLNVLEDYLDSFKGAIIAVSHDRYFLDRVTQHLFAIEDKRMVPCIGGYQSYLDTQRAREEAVRPAVKAVDKPAIQPVKKAASAVKFTFKEQRDFDTIDEVIAGLEEKLTQLERDMEKHSAEYTKVQELMQEQEETQQKLEEAMERWMFLQEKWEQIQEAKK